MNFREKETESRVKMFDPRTENSNQKADNLSRTSKIVAK